MTLYVVRHGRVPSNDLGIVSGRNDEKLTEIGIKQAENMRDRLSATKFDAIYSSDVPRALQTAKIINTWGLNINEDSRLAEREPGGLLGKDRKEIDKNLWNSLTIERTKEGAETLKSCLIRTKSILNEIEELYQNSNVLIVTHNVICKCIWMIENNITDMNQINSFMQENDEIRKYVKKGRGRKNESDSWMYCPKRR